jgi:cytochrome oxidase Cu insertion factor (SCO1/SenC/PrrC family)
VAASLAAALYFATRSSPAGLSSVVPVSDTAAAIWPAGKERAPDFALRDQHGAPISLAALRGRPVIVTFIDPLCRDFCPIEAQHLNDVVRTLPTGEKPAILAVSVNIYGNAHSNLTEDARKWKLVAQWRWAIGAPSALSRVWSAYHIAVLATTKKVAGVKVHTIGHTEAAYVIDAQGFQRALFLWPYSAAGVLKTLRALTS